MQQTMIVIGATFKRVKHQEQTIRIKGFLPMDRE